MLAVWRCSQPTVRSSGIISCSCTRCLTTMDVLCHLKRVCGGKWKVRNIEMSAYFLLLLFVFAQCMVCTACSSVDVAHAVCVYQRTRCMCQREPQASTTAIMPWCLWSLIEMYSWCRSVQRLAFELTFFQACTHDVFLSTRCLVNLKPE